MRTASLTSLICLFQLIAAISCVHCLAQETGPASTNLIANGSFADAAGSLPDGWTAQTPNAALAPTFRVEAREGAGHYLVADGNGRNECFGYVRHAVRLTSGKTYRLRVRFRTERIEDVNRHLVHLIYSSAFNEGVFEYRREGEWIVGERSFTGPISDEDAEVRLYFRYSPKGRAIWDFVELIERDPMPSRPVTIAVSWGSGDRKHWTKFLDAAGERGVDVALLPEFCNVDEKNGDKPVAPELIDGPTATFMAEKAKQWKMYVSGTFRRRDKDLVFNSAPLFDRQGELVGVYDKNMLFDPEMEQGTSPGSGYPVFQTDFGKIGILICYDSWFPETARLLSYRGAELILLPNAGYYRELMHARAADNGVAIAVSSTNGPAGVWDAGGNEAGELHPHDTRFSPNTALTGYHRDEDVRMVVATVDLAQQPSPHYWGGPMRSAPGSRKVRQTLRVPIEEEIAKEARRWHSDTRRSP